MMHWESKFNCKPRGLIALMVVSTILLIVVYMRNQNSQLIQVQVKRDSCLCEIFTSNQLPSIEVKSQLEPSNYAIKHPPTIHHLNNTRNADQDSLIFNRVPKAGSQAIMTLLMSLAYYNRFNFSFHRAIQTETIRLNPLGQMELIIMLADTPKPWAFAKHVAYTNFTLHGVPEPIYFNMVRDPIERVISWFYYGRQESFWYYRKKQMPGLEMPDQQWFNKDFETCVLEGDAECTFVPGEVEDGSGDHRRQTLFYCGHDDICMPFNSAEALERAKYVVDKTYAVVGVLEDLNTTLTVLDHYIPRFFKGAFKIYWDNPKKFKEVNKTPVKKPVSEKTKNLLRKNFTNEIEFYHFCRQRLNAQYAALKLKN